MTELASQVMPKAKFWLFERDKEDERKIARRSHSYVERFFAKSDEVAAKKPKLQPEGLVKPVLDIFENLFVLGRPASGKSEFLDFMSKLPDGERASRFHIGKMRVIDDFVYLWEKFEEDDLWEKVRGQRIHSKRSGHGYILDSGDLFDFLIEKLNFEIGRRYLRMRDKINGADARRPEETRPSRTSRTSQGADDEGNAADAPFISSRLLNDAGFYADNTLLIEFSRGGERPYKPALARFDRKIWERAVILYVEVSGAESTRRNEARYREKLKSSILAHKCPDEDMARFYRDDDWPEITGKRRDGFLELAGVKVPFATMMNEPESTDPAVLGPRYGEALGKLWEMAGETGNR